ncbi:MAG: hypothetical protein ACEQSB_01525 [Undibacterium sp.]
MSLMNQQAMIVGYIFELALVGWIGWYAVAALRRRQATREYRAHERAKAKVQATPVGDADPYGGEPVGHC